MSMLRLKINRFIVRTDDRIVRTENLLMNKYKFSPKNVVLVVSSGTLIHMLRIQSLALNVEFNIIDQCGQINLIP